MPTPRLTPHQAETLRRIASYTARSGRSAPSAFIRCRSACIHLVEKGHITAVEVTGPRGGTTYGYWPTELGWRAAGWVA